MKTICIKNVLPLFLESLKIRKMKSLNPGHHLDHVMILICLKRWKSSCTLYYLFFPGSVSIRNRIDYDDARKVNSSYFEATVIDTGDPELTATASVSVIFRNINDNFPEFQDPVSFMNAVNFNRNSSFDRFQTGQKFPRYSVKFHRKKNVLQTYFMWQL